MRWRPRLALTAGLALAAPSMALAGEPARVIDVEVDTVSLPEGRASLLQSIEGELQRMLGEAEQPAGVFLAEDRRLYVEITPGPIPDADDLLIYVEVQLEGEAIAQSLTENCLTCTNEEIAGMALMLLEPLLEQLPGPPRPPAPALASDEAPADSIDNPTQRAPARGPMIAGATLLGAGALGLGVGLGLVAANERVVSPPGGAILEVIEYRQAGIAVAIVSGVALATGAALLSFSLGQRQRTRLSAVPFGGAGAGGLSFVGRF